jgi:hypothetical protein
VSSVADGFDIIVSPRQRVSIDWVDAELANLRTGFRWAVDRRDLDTAAAIAAHTTIMGFALQRWPPKPVGLEPDAVRYARAQIQLFRAELATRHGIG